MQKFWHLFNWNFAQVKTAEEWWGGAGRRRKQVEWERVSGGVMTSVVFFWLCVTSNARGHFKINLASTLCLRQLFSNCEQHMQVACTPVAWNLFTQTRTHKELHFNFNFALRMRRKQRLTTSDLFRTWFYISCLLTTDCIGSWWHCPALC